MIRTRRKADRLLGKSEGSTAASRAAGFRWASLGAVAIAFSIVAGVSLGEVPNLLDFAIYATGTGCGGITISGNAYVDSFDSSQGTYAQTKQLSKGIVGVSGNINLSGSATINGPIFALDTGVGACTNGAPGITLSGRAKAAGSDIQLSAAPPFTFAQGKLFGLFLPPNPPPSIRVVRIGGVVLSTPEFTVNQPTPITVAVEARNIPPGTAVDLQFFPEIGPDQSVTTTPLKGAFELSRATASLTLPSGRSQCYVRQPGNNRQSERANYKCDRLDVYKDRHSLSVRFTNLTLTSCLSGKEASGS